MESAIELSARRARGIRAEGARNPKLNFVRSRGVSRRSRRGGMWVRGRGAHLTAERPMTAGLFPSTRTRTKRDGVKTVLQNGQETGWGPNRKASVKIFTGGPPSQSDASEFLCARESVLAGKIVQQWRTTSPTTFFFLRRGGEIETGPPHNLPRIVHVGRRGGFT